MKDSSDDPSHHEQSLTMELHLSHSCDNNTFSKGAALFSDTEYLIDLLSLWAWSSSVKLPLFHNHIFDASIAIAKIGECIVK